MSTSVGVMAILLAFLQTPETPSEVSRYLSMVEAGQAEQVRGEIPALLAKYPNNPAVLYLQGVVTVDGTEAVRIYQSIVDNFPKSEWADDALFKVHQFYHAIGLYRTAEIKLNQLKTNYPSSPYVTGAASPETAQLPEEKQPPAAEPSLSPPDVTVAEPPAETKQPPVPVETARGQYALQVGAYSLQENAEKQKLFFEDLGFPVEVINKVKDTRSLYIVLVGNFKSTDEARARGAEIKKNYNIQSMVVTR